jgi:hypothetical protein
LIQLRACGRWPNIGNARLSANRKTCCEIKGRVPLPSVRNPLGLQASLRSKTSFTRSQNSGKMTKVNAPSAFLFGSGSSFRFTSRDFRKTRFFTRFLTLALRIRFSCALSPVSSDTSALLRAPSFLGWDLRPSRAHSGVCETFRLTRMPTFRVRWSCDTLNICRAEALCCAERCAASVS